MKAAVYGEVIWDVYPEEKVIGGAPFNFSAHLSHLGDEAYLISAVGRDDLGDAAIRQMEKHGIRHDLVMRSDKGTGSCIVTLDENKVPNFNVLSDTAYDNVEIGQKECDFINSLGCDVFYFNTLIQRSEVSERSLHTILDNCRFDDIFCDVNLRKDCFCRESLLLCLEKATLIKVSDEEAHFIYELGLLPEDEKGEPFPIALAKKYKNLKAVIYTLGKNGSQVYDAKSGELHSSGIPEKVRVVSTVGAGDCFGATFLHWFFLTGDIDRAIKEATERSNIVVSHREAVPF